MRLALHILRSERVRTASNSISNGCVSLLYAIRSWVWSLHTIHNILQCLKITSLRLFGLVWLSYSVSAAVCAAMPGVTGVADSRRGADVSRHRPTSLSKEPSVPRGLPVSGSLLLLRLHQRPKSPQPLRVIKQKMRPTRTSQQKSFSPLSFKFSKASKMHDNARSSRWLSSNA